MVAKGIPTEEIAYIHEANTDARKSELFSKVRSGHVRVLIGSTSKMGAGTNVQDRLIALHDLDCPWRPGDLEQRKGRIVRQGNQNPKVHIYRYVTEGTFDAYLWQTVENKQKFISQIMTSKSPVRSCEDVDETALSYAEIKALCAGDPRIKERMDLDIDVSRLKLMKADHQSNQFRLEDNLLKYFPQKIEECNALIRNLKIDIQLRDEHPLPQEGFCGIELHDRHWTDKAQAGSALLEFCKQIHTSDPVQVGSYRGFGLSLLFDSFSSQYELFLRGNTSHKIVLGSDPRGNLIRMDNVLTQIEHRLSDAQAQLENLHQQKAAAKDELGKPFPLEQELKYKMDRLIFLNTQLNLDKGDTSKEAASSSPEDSPIFTAALQQIISHTSEPESEFELQA